MRIVIIVLFLAMIVGCNDSQRHDAVNNDSTQAVITVNGHVLTKGTLQSRAEMMLKFKQLQDPSMKVSAVGKLKKDLMDTYPKFFIEQTIWADYAKSQKVKVDKRMLERVRSRAMRSLGSKTKTKYGAFRSKFGNLAPVLDEHIRMMALTASAKRHLCDLNPTNFPPEFASNAVKRIKDYNVRMAMTNALVYARATNCWEKLKSGADFTDMVFEYSELEQERKDKGEWGTLDLQQLEPDEKLYNFVKTHKPGEFSPPLEGDNGLMILRIDDRKDVECTLSRIYFLLPMFADELTAEQILRQEREKHDKQLVESKYAALRKAAKIVKPKAEKSAKDNVKKSKAKKAQKKPMSSQEAKKLKERQEAADKLKATVKGEVFSGAKPKADSKISQEQNKKTGNTK